MSDDQTDRVQAFAEAGFPEGTYSPDHLDALDPDIEAGTESAGDYTEEAVDDSTEAS